MANPGATKESVGNPIAGGAGDAAPRAERKGTMRTQARDTALETLEAYAAFTYADPPRMARRGSGGPKGPAGVKGMTAESVAQALSLALMDKDGDGVISQEEKDETTQKMVDECNNLLVNLGVVGALILSIVFPMCLQDYIASPKAKSQTPRPALVILIQPPASHRGSNA